MEKTFYFVDGIQADRSAKRLMRRHVMKGKNAGKRLHRSSRLALSRRTQNPDNINIERAMGRLKSAEGCFNNWEFTSLNTETLRLGKEIAAFTPPVEVTPYSLLVINDFFAYVTTRLYPVHLGFSMHDVKLMWIQILSSDAEAFKCSISLMQVCNELFMGDGNSSPKALHYLSHTFALVNKRLRSDEALSDSTIGIIVSLISQEQIRRNRTAAEIHIRGLGRIVELRGGLDKLEAEGSLLLVLRICKPDIVFALQHGGPTRFFRDRMPQVRKTLAKKGLHLDDVSVASAAHHKQLHLHLREILRNIMGVCALFNHSLGNFMLESHTFLEIVVSTFNHLLRFCPFDNSKPEPTVDAIYHIGLTLFMMTMFLHRGRRRVVDHELVSVRLRYLLDSELDDYDDELIFWLVTICGIWVTDAADGDWPVPMMHDTAQRLGVDTWSKAQAVVRRFPWLNSVHDEPGLNLWNKVSLYQRF